MEAVLPPLQTPTICHAVSDYFRNPVHRISGFHYGYCQWKRRKERDYVLVYGFLTSEKVLFQASLLHVFVDKKELVFLPAVT
jgi:hypothetical protein